MSNEAPQVNIAKADHNDLDAVVDLFMGYLKFYGRRHDRKSVATFLAERQQRLESQLLIAQVEIDNESFIAGMAHVYPTFSTLSLAPTWTLNDLFVAPSMRGLGVGRLLLQGVRERAKQVGATKVALETATNNAAARRIYESEGFKVDSGFVHYTLPLD